DVWTALVHLEGDRGIAAARRPLPDRPQRKILSQKMRTSFLLFTFACGIASAAFAAEQSPAEAKLREALRNTMLQLRTAQSERDTLQITKDQLEMDKKEALEKLAALGKESTAKQAVAEK